MAGTATGAIGGRRATARSWSTTGTGTCTTGTCAAGRRCARSWSTSGTAGSIAIGMTTATTATGTTTSIGTTVDTGTRRRGGRCARGHRARASAASKTRPVLVHSSAWLMPTTRGRNHDEQASGTMPRRANTKPNLAVSLARRMSIGSVMVTPTPTAGPLIGADHRLGAVEDPQRHQAAAVAWARRRRSPVAAAVAKVSPPMRQVGPGAEPPPPPVMTTTRTSSSASA